MANKEFIVGFHAIYTLLQREPERIIRCYLQKERADKKITSLLQLATQNEIPITYATRHELDRLSQTSHHQGVVAHCLKTKKYSESDLPTLIEHLTHPALLLILDGIQDPHNLGACFRTADAFGVNFIVAPKDKSSGLTPVVSKAASGALVTIPFVEVTNLSRAMKTIKESGIWIYGATEDGKDTIYQTDFSQSLAIVLGSEGKGLRRLTREHCDFLVNIPMQGSVSSLNVSVATGVVLSEVTRQRKYQ